MSADDASAVVAIRRAGNRDVDSFIGALGTASQELLFEQLSRSPYALSFVCTADGEIDGFLVLSIASAPAVWRMILSGNKSRLVVQTLGRMLRRPSLLPRAARRFCWLIRARWESRTHASIHIGRDKATLLAVGVQDEHLRSGVGTLMFATALSELSCRYPQVTSVDVWVRAENSRAKRFFASVGFVPSRAAVDMDGDPSQEMILDLPSASRGATKSVQYACIADVKSNAHRD